MLAHVGEPAAVVVPVSAEGLVRTVGVVGFRGGRAEPQVVVEGRRYGLRFEVFAAHPVEFPREARGPRDGHLQRPSEHAALHEFLERFDRRTEPVEGVRKAEPRIEAEDAPVAPDGLDDALALADGACHGFLAPDVLAGLGSLDGHDAVPVGRGGDVYDIDIRVGDQVAVEVVGFQRLAELAPAQLRGAPEVVAVHVADGHQPAFGCAGEVVAAAADAADADDALGELVARGDASGSAQHPPRDDGEERGGTRRFQEVSAVDSHGFRSVCGWTWVIRAS